MLENNSRKVITNASNIRNINNTLFSVINVFIIVCISMFSRPSKSLLKIKCKLTDKYAHIPILNISDIINNTFLFIPFLLCRNSLFLFYCN